MFHSCPVAVRCPAAFSADAMAGRVAFSAVMLTMSWSASSLTAWKRGSAPRGTICLAGCCALCGAVCCAVCRAGLPPTDSALTSALSASMAAKSLVSIPSGFVPSPAFSASMTASVRVAQVRAAFCSMRSIRLTGRRTVRVLVFSLMAAALHVVRFVVLFVLRSVMRFVVRVEFDVVQLSCTEGRRLCVAGVPFVYMDK